MAGYTFSELVRAILLTLATAWRPCQPLLATAALVALAIAAAVGLFFPGEIAETLAALPMMALTLAVSAGVAGYIVSGNTTFTQLGGVFREPRSYAFVLRYVLLSLGLSLPLVAVLPSLAMPGGAGPGVGTGLVVLAVLIVTLWLAARLAPFPYSVFLERPLSVGETFQATHGHAAKIVGCIALFGGLILLAVTALTFVAGGLITGIGSATGLGGGAAAGLALQSLGQIAVAYAVDCVYGTITRLADPGRGVRVADEGQG